MVEVVKCDVCVQPMSYEYDVTERDTQFVLWTCECGHRLLERRPGKGYVPLQPDASLLAEALK